MNALRRIWPLLLALPAIAQKPAILTDAAEAGRLGRDYLELTRRWGKDAVFTSAETTAMERGRQYEKEMTEGLDDPLGKRILALGEPDFDKAASFYPGKILDRTVLGGYSDSRRPGLPGDGADDEFAVWWNGAMGANLIRHKVPATTLQVAHNTNIAFRVGEAAEMFGRVRAEGTGLRYEDGYLPILRNRYRHGGIVYEATYVHAPPDNAWIRVELRNETDAPLTALLHEEIRLLRGGPADAVGGEVRDAVSRTVLAHSDPAAKWDATRQLLTHSVPLPPAGRRAIYFNVPYLPGSAAALRASDFQSRHAAERAFWLELLAKGTRIEIPDERIGRIWKALLLQNFVLADGPRFTYGSGLRYNDSYYPVENAFGTHVFAMYGHKDYALGLLPWAFRASVTPEAAGRKYQNRRALPMHHMLALWRLTGDASVFHAWKHDLYRIAEEIVAERRTTMTGPDLPRPLHWGWLPPDKPGVDVIASTQAVYCPAHNITNCQGLQDFGEFLLATGLDLDRGRRYVDEARLYRADLMRSMEAAAIRLPGRPPFVDLQTLYFRETPDYGPDPYDHIALGRVQGAYYQYWVDMQLQFHFFNPDDPVGNWIAGYVQARGGKLAGMTRARKRPGDDSGWINAVYNHAYHNYRLRQGKVEDFLLGFHGRLAYAMSRNLYVASEGSPITGYNTRDGGFVDAGLTFPNSAANAETLSMLRTMLLHEEMRDNRPTGIVHLLRGAPLAWREPGKRIAVERAPTFLGEISFRAEGTPGGARVEISGPHPALHVHLRRRLDKVLVDGRGWHAFDAAEGVVRLPKGGATRIEAYGPVR